MRLLIDADILAYKTSFSAEVKTKWDDGLWTWHAQESEAIQKCSDWIGNIHEHLGCNPKDSIFCFTGKTNWRHGVMPEYKASRKEVRTPLCINPVKEWIKSNFYAEQEEPLEADDLLGIYAAVYGEEAILVSQDKDFKQIPGKKCKDVGQPIIEVKPFEGFLWHMTQTLTGDTTDGYKGCPGCGPVKAEKALAGCTTEPQAWQKVLAQFIKAGLGEEEALRQARVAKILTTRDPALRLWNPPGPF